MNGKDDPEVAGKIKDVIIRALELDLTRDQLPDSTPLYSSLIRMDSITLLQIIVALEKELAVEIDDEDVMNTDLSDLGSLVDMTMKALESDEALSGKRRPTDTVA